MIKKFIDGENTYIFIKADNKIILCVNGNCEYTINIITMPETIKDAIKTISLNVWYPINNIV